MPELLGSTDYKSSIMVMGLLLQTYGSVTKDVTFAAQPILLISLTASPPYYTFQLNNEHLYNSHRIPEFGW